MKITAEIEVQCKDPENIISSIKPDDKESHKFSVKLKAKKGALVIQMDSEDIAGLQAGLNSYLRLIRTIEGLK